MATSNVTADRLRHLLNYDQSTGVFTWALSRRGKIVKGAVAGHARPLGAQLRLDGKLYYMHRLAWLYVHGEWPVGVIDHIDGNPLNNRLSNLRDVTQGVNLQNQRRAKAGASVAALGVSKGRHGKKLRARIVVDGREIGLGEHQSVDQASEAYLSAKRRLHEGCSI